MVKRPLIALLATLALVLASAPRADSEQVRFTGYEPFRTWANRSAVPFPNPLDVLNNVEACRPYQIPVCVGYDGVMRWQQGWDGGPDGDGNTWNARHVFYHETGHVWHVEKPGIQGVWVDIDPYSTSFDRTAAERFADMFRNCALRRNLAPSRGPEFSTTTFNEGCYSIAHLLPLF